MCKQKALNYLLTDGDKLYEELFDVNMTDKNGGQTGETDQERQDRLMVRQQNRLNFDSYLRKHLGDRLDQELFFTAPVLDTRAFYPQTYRPPIPRSGVIKAMVALGVNKWDAEAMAAAVSADPADRHQVREACCRYSCSVCHQYELTDGTQVLGFKPRNKTVELEVAEWSAWQRASPLVGDRGGRGKQYVLNMCARCWQSRRPSQIAANEKKKRKRSLFRADTESNTPQRSDPGATVSAAQKKIDVLVDHCAVHRAKGEASLWSKFGRLHATLNRMTDRAKARQYKAVTIREIASATNMTSAHCLLRYQEWPRRERMCDRRMLDRVLKTEARKRLSAWRKLLEGTWRTSSGLITLTTRIHRQRKILEWQSQRDGQIHKRYMRIRKKVGKEGKTWRQFALAGGSDKRVQLWLVNTTTSTDNNIIWRAYNSCFGKIEGVADKVYTRVKNVNNE